MTSLALLPLAEHAPCRAGVPLDAIGFQAWLADAPANARITYHQGLLAVDTARVITDLSEPDRRRLVALAAAARQARDAGLVHLVQQRLGSERFAYIAIARPKPRAAAVPQSQPVTTKEAA